MRTVAVREAHPLDHCDVPLVVQLLQGPHGRVEAHMVAEGQNLVCRHPQSWPFVVVVGVTVGNYRIDSIVAP